MKRKNLIFFMTDQQRADTLGTVVNGQEITPNWNALYADSVSFSKAYDSCPLCVPARTSLATGMNPLHTGMLLNDLPGKYAKDNIPLHEYLYRNGYEVAHVGVNHISLNPKLKDRIVFSRWVDDESYREYAEGKGLDISRQPLQCDYVQENCEGEYKKRPYSNTKVMEWGYSLEDFKDIWFTDKAVEYIRSAHAKPFALFVCLWAPHPPLTVPREYIGLFPPESISLPENVGCANPDEPLSYRTGAPRQLASNPPDKGWAEAWSAHAALSRLCDDQLGRLLRAVCEAGLAEDTAIVCTTDHGEQLGQHNMYQKMEMYESAVRVPAIFHFPDLEAKEYHTPISHLDFVPTILEYLIGGSEQPAFDGISLLEYMHEGCEPPKRDIFSLYNGNHQFGDTRRMIVRYPYKLIYDGIDVEFFNLEDDPLEMRNLHADPAQHGIIQEMMLALRDWSSAFGDKFVSYEGFEDEA